MSKRIVVNAGVTETRLAVQDGTQLVELYVERAGRRSIVGNIYKGVVTNVLPGMQAAFVDIGLQKDAFLYAGDYTADRGEDPRAVLPDADEDAADLDDAEGESESGPPESDPEAEPEHRRDAVAPIEELLRKGQEVLVQVSKESLGTKGARITSFVSIPGRYIVYMPQSGHVGVSRRIRDDAERDRLRGIVKGLPPPPGGFIVRTVAESKAAEELTADIQFLTRLWGQVQSRFESAPAPSLLHEEMDLTFRVVRDLFSPDIEEFLVDTPAAFEKCLHFAESLVPQLASRVKLYEAPQPVFESTGIEKEIDKALRRRVWLKSGGYIVIDHTEALVAIDVNTGKYVGKSNRLEDTIVKTNTEAVKEIVRQIRLRDLGGIIVLDFIDMEEKKNRQKILQAVEQELKKDRSPSKALQVSDFGLVIITRKRVKQSLERVLTEPCPYCSGSGVIKSSSTICYEILNEVKKVSPDLNGHRLLLRVNPDIARALKEEEQAVLKDLKQSIGKDVSIKADVHLHHEQFDVMAV